MIFFAALLARLALEAESSSRATRTPRPKPVSHRTQIRSRRSAHYNSFDFRVATQRDDKASAGRPSALAFDEARNVREITVPAWVASVIRRVILPAAPAGEIAQCPPRP